MSINVLALHRGGIQRYYTEREPDMLRLLFNKQGRILSYSELSRKGVPEPKGTAWIYLEREVEATFEMSGPVEKPLTDEVKTLCQLGDPDEIKPIGADQMVCGICNREGAHDFLDGKKTAKQVQPLPTGCEFQHVTVECESFDDERTTPAVRIAFDYNWLLRDVERTLITTEQLNRRIDELARVSPRTWTSRWCWWESFVGASRSWRT
jgi:hypothetical protein